MNYQQSCKVSLMYKARFWERLGPPVNGGCDSTDILGICSVCYPYYNINGTDPGIILASYISGTLCRSMAALCETDYVASVHRAMVQVRRPVAAEQYICIYNRQLREIDDYQAGACAALAVEQQDPRLLAYYQTEFKTIFVAEHAWVFSAWDSSFRSTTQLLLDLGLVDAAKQFVDEWMGRWISV